MILLFYQSAFNTGGHRQQQQTVTPPDPPQYPEDDGPDPFRDDQNLETGTGTFTDSTTDTEILDDEPDPFRDDIGGRDPEYDDEFQEILDELDGEIEDDWQR